MKKLLIILIIIICNISFAQEQVDTVSNQVDATEFAPMTKSPTGALIRSFIFPGLGQLYVENYWKAPVMAGAFVGVGSIIYWNHNKYSQAVDEMNLFEGEDDELALRILKNKRDFYRDQRDLAGLYMLGVYIVAAVDAYVGAHLFDFDVDEDLSYNITSNQYGVISIVFSYRF